MVRLSSILIICLLLIASCTVSRYYELNNPIYPAIRPGDKWKTYQRNIDGIGIEVKAIDKDRCDIYVSLKIMNNRLDTLYADMGKAELWHTGGHFSPYVQNKGGKMIGEKVIMISPGKQANVTVYDFVCDVTKGEWVQTAYAFPGAIYTSSGFEVTLDTLEFVLPQEQ